MGETGGGGRNHRHVAVDVGRITIFSSAAANSDGAPADAGAEKSSLVERATRSRKRCCRVGWSDCKQGRARATCRRAEFTSVSRRGPCRELDSGGSRCRQGVLRSTTGRRQCNISSVWHGLMYISPKLWHV